MGDLHVLHSTLDLCNLNNESFRQCKPESMATFTSNVLSIHILTVPYTGVTGDVWSFSLSFHLSIGHYICPNFFFNTF